MNPPPEKLDTLLNHYVVQLRNARYRDNIPQIDEAITKIEETLNLSESYPALFEEYLSDLIEELQFLVQNSKRISLGEKEAYLKELKSFKDWYYDVIDNYSDQEIAQIIKKNFNVPPDELEQKVNLLKYSTSFFPVYLRLIQGQAGDLRAYDEELQRKINKFILAALLANQPEFIVVLLEEWKDIEPSILRKIIVRIFNGIDLLIEDHQKDSLADLALNVSRFLVQKGVDISSSLEEKVDFLHQIHEIQRHSRSRGKVYQNYFLRRQEILRVIYQEVFANSGPELDQILQKPEYFRDFEWEIEPVVWQNYLLRSIPQTKGIKRKIKLIEGIDKFDPEVLPAAGKTLLEEEDGEIRKALSRRLAKSRPASYIEQILLPKLVRSLDENQLRLALQIMQEKPQPADVQFLATLFSNISDDFKLEILKALKTATGPEVADVFVAALENPEIAEKTMEILRFSQVQDPRITEILFGYLEGTIGETSSESREQAKLIINCIVRQNREDILEYAFNDSDPIYFKILGRVKTADISQIRAKDHKNLPLADQLEYLRKIFYRDREIEDYLEQHISDPKARKALWDIGREFDANEVLNQIDTLKRWVAKTKQDDNELYQHLRSQVTSKMLPWRFWVYFNLFRILDSMYDSKLSQENRKDFKRVLLEFLEKTNWELYSEEANFFIKELNSWLDGDVETIPEAIVLLKSKM